MRPLRLTLSAVVAALLVTTGLSSTAHAALPVGCYGLPDYPSAFLCITSFTPAEAVPNVDTDGSTVTVPRFCVGECYGPTPVSVPSVSDDGGTIMILVYNGQTYVVSTNGGLPPIPPIPPIPPLPESGTCPGNSLVASVETSPYVCAHRGYDYYYGDTLYVGTCAAGTECAVVQVPLGDLQSVVDAVRNVVREPTTLVGIVCTALNLYCTIDG